MGNSSNILPIINLIAGFTSKKEKIMNKLGPYFIEKGYSVYSCDRIGHNERNGDILAWRQSIHERNERINTLN